jgi:phage RecT family recombinase
MPSRTENRAPAAPNTETRMTVTEERKAKAASISRSLEGRRDQLLAMLGGDEKLADKFLTVALSAVTKSNDLLDADPLSILNSVRDAAQMGLEPAGPMGDGTIVAYQGVAQFQPMVRGLRKLALQAPGVTVVNVGIRHEKDEFEYREGSDPFIRHVPWTDDDETGAVMGAYAYARMNGETLVLYMNNAEIQKRKNVARTKKVWDAWPEEMAKKTVLRRLISEKLPMTTSLGRALAVEEADLDPTPTVSTPNRAAIAAPGSRTRARLTAGDDGGADTPETPQDAPRAAEGSEAESVVTDERSVAPEPSSTADDPGTDPNVAAAMALAKEQGR